MCLVLASGNEADGYEISLSFVEQLLEHFREQRSLHRRFACQIILEVCIMRLLSKGVLEACCLRECWKPDGWDTQWVPA